MIRRKLATGRAAQAEGGPGADRSWRLAFARAARDKLKLPVDFNTMALQRCSLAELLEIPAERSMILVLDGPKEGLGLLVLSPDVMAAMIEVQTIGKVGTHPVPARKPTRTDAAMVVGTIDAALAGLEDGLQEEADLVWAGGFRYASFLDDPRPLGLLLDDISYRVLRAEISLGLGARVGQVVLAVPAEGRGRMPALRPARVVEDVMSGPAFSTALAAQVEGADCVLAGILARVSMPLARVMALKVGEVLILPSAALDRISLEGLDGRQVAEGRLGQNRGLRAVRIGTLMAEGTPGKAATKGIVIAAEPTAHPGEGERLRQSA